MSLLERDRTALVVIDVQEGFRPYDVFADVARGAGTLVEAARVLGVPVIATEQYPKGLGATAPEVGLNGATTVEKTVFSAVRAEGFDLGARDQVLICGIEAHVCVSQTVHDLLDRGIEVHVAADAVGSRHPVDYDRALPRLEKAGAVVTTIEAALLELCERAGTPEFKAVQGLIL
ncbi:MAG: isochorismatase hydrolase [Solirubrobacteraceae bacterium]|nr:isochorismatase hydrolase [Solirubrobacteraceae bacterium]